MTDVEYPWRDADTLRRICEQSRSKRQAAKKLDCTTTTICDWYDRHELDVDFNVKQTNDTVTFECSNCTAENTKPASAVSESEKKFCDVECMSVFYEDTIDGSDLPWYEGGQKSDYSDGWNRARRKVLKRDGYTCQNCGATEEKIGRAPDVHHIVPIKKFDDASEAHQPDNLVALCRTCHAKIERTLEPQEQREHLYE